MLYDKLHAQWEILKMRAAYVAAEQLIVQEAAKGNDLTGVDTSTPEGFFHAEIDEFGNVIRHVSEEEYLIAQGNEVQDKLDKALLNEDYRKAAMYQNVLKGLELKYTKLKNKKK